jgi:hypothetical protein
MAGGSPALRSIINFVGCLILLPLPFGLRKTLSRPGVRPTRLSLGLPCAVPALARTACRLRASKRSGTYSSNARAKSSCSSSMILSLPASPHRKNRTSARPSRYVAAIPTSQIPVSDWHESLGGGRLAVAVLDRIIRGAHRTELASKDSMSKPRPDLP